MVLNANEGRKEAEDPIFDRGGSAFTHRDPGFSHMTLREPPFGKCFAVHHPVIFEGLKGRKNFFVLMHEPKVHFVPRSYVM